jgi:penicillin-binding protein 2
MRNPFEVYTNSAPSSSKNRPLDWEESAADTQGFVEGVHDTDRSVPQLWWLKTFLFISLAIIFGRLFYLQIIQGSKLRALSEDNRIRKQTILAPRGIIKDRNGQVLAQNTASFNLVAVPFDLPKQNLSEEIGNLAATFGLNETDVSEKLKNIDPKSIQPVIIKQDIPPEQSILFETRASEFIGFSVQNIPVRQYLQPEVFSSMLGYAGLVSPGDLSNVNKDKYDVVDFIGKTGLEAQYEKYLHGTNGEDLVEVDATGKLLNVLGENSPMPGNTLILNIDRDLQQQLYDSLEKGMAGRKAAAVAINPKNGQVLAILSLPGFNNNLFAHGIKTEDYQKLLNDKSLPLFNRSIGGVYPPGSTVKPMVAAAALQENVVSESTVINDRGLLVVPSQYDPSVKYNFYGWKHEGLGPMTVRSAIALSSDIYFYTVAGGTANSSIQGLGAERLAEYYKKFNLGQATGIDLPGEKTGLVPTPEWKGEHFKDDPILNKWYLGDTYHIGIGQGDLLVTPLQVAEWTATIANNGIGYKPQILNTVLDASGNTVFKNDPQVLIPKFLSDKTLKIVQEGMRQTVLAGTAKPLQSLSITSAGKTGTSQFDGSDPTRTHAWFTAYAPYEDPQIVITVLVEAGGEGNAVAEPVVQQALKWWAENRYHKNN